MLKWLRQKLGPRRLDDPVFGELLYMGGYWEGGGEFGRLTDRIEWFVEAGPDGPGESQRALLLAIQARYDRLLPAVTETILPHATAWSRHELDRAALDAMLRLAAVDVPAEESELMSWALYYESRLPGTPHFVVQMKGWTPSGQVEVSD